MNDRSQRIEKAYDEAAEFMNRVEELREDPQEGRMSLLTGSKKTGAIMRQSMELTRALADMRRSN